ncbi:tryptophanase [Nitratireductor pacificus]|uniref:Tyrosine phenol-lyase n=1 Tax=Nitratireductor pacificus pht-3B TaxID=391937 RepID=K2N0F4_9HYPH|nr:tryptophanase [Nitratireductor pacificus]EKF17673.1 tyrosine phenol-lyase [Nitratireductor pacificus pht-3B]
MDHAYLPEPWRIKAVEPMSRPAPATLHASLRKAGFNTCLLHSRDVYIDLFTDSGTNAMSAAQWAAMMVGDEAYAGATSFYRFHDTIRGYYGYEHIIPVHQGRAAENIISQCLVWPGSNLPGNMYFPSTRIHQELNGGTFHDAIIDEGHDPSSAHPFKGNFDIGKLRDLIKRLGAATIPYVCVGATVNMAGGQPISMANLAAVRELANEHGIMVVLDAARAIENAWFIKTREEEWRDRSIAEILLAMCDLTDAATMSAKKDSFANIGGWLGVRSAELAEQARSKVLLYEGLHTYGGMAGRDMEAIAQGIEESVQEDSIRARVEQVAYLGNRLIAADVPVVMPIGGHAVYLDAAATLSHVPREEFPAQTLAAAIYERSGVRGVERGAISAGRHPETGANRMPKLELVRFAIPRRVYTRSHMDFVADSIIDVHRSRHRILRGLRFVHEPKHLRFFQARFEPMQGSELFADE